jgi:protein-disulfide isomerase
MRSTLDVVATLAVIVAAASIVWSTWKPLPQPGRSISIPSQPIPIDKSPSLGVRTAPIVMIEYSDFECPYCRRFARETLPALTKEYIQLERLLLVFKHLPIDRIHKLATKAAEAAECSAHQGRFWEAHDRFFRIRGPSTKRACSLQLGFLISTWPALRNAWTAR